jgi:hypothetical protein
MENKYYTPEIEEFHVGFEYERRMKEDNDDFMQYDGPAWIGCTYPNDCALGNASTKLGLKYLEKDIDRCRVKYLDREDIESLGFIMRKEQFGDTYLYRLDLVKPLFPHHTELDTLYLAYYRHDARCILFLQKIKRVGIDEERPETQLFNGYIKNKSELKKVLKMIGL